MTQTPQELNLTLQRIALRGTFLTKTPSILLETCGPIQHETQSGLQLQLGVQAPPPGLLKLTGCSEKMFVWTAPSLAALNPLQSLV